MRQGKPYTIFQDHKTGAWYCARKEYPYIPVFGSVGDKAKAQKVCKERNRDTRWLDSEVD